MLISAHVTCAQVLDTLKTSGLTYTLNETPYSVYLTVRKKYTKEYTPSQHTNNLDTDNCKDTLAQLLQEEIANHNLTRQELVQKDEELGRAVDANNQNVEESRVQYFRQLDTITKLTDELAKEEEEHAQAEHALRSLEEKVEKLESKLERDSKDNRAYIEEKDSLQEKLEDAEQEIENSHKLIKNLNEKILHFELKQAELNSLDTTVMKAKVTELEGIIKGKNQIISVLTDQAKLSLQEITKLRQSSGPLASSDTPHLDTSEHLPSPRYYSSPGTPPPSSSQSGTSTRNVQSSKTLRSHMKVKTIDQNFNLPPIHSSKNLSPNSEAFESSAPPSTPNNSASHSHLSSSGPALDKNSEKFCQNCKNQLPDDFDVTLPPPVYFYDFLAECPSPWLHYGYCTPCLVVARFNNSTNITEHIAQCPALLDQCWDGEHENLIAEYEQKELAQNTATTHHTHF